MEIPEIKPELVSNGLEEAIAEQQQPILIPPPAVGQPLNVLYVLKSDALIKGALCAVGVGIGIGVLCYALYNSREVVEAVQEAVQDVVIEQ